jgi:hypothetical protein
LIDELGNLEFYCNIYLNLLAQQAWPNEKSHGPLSAKYSMNIKIITTAITNDKTAFNTYFRLSVGKKFIIQPRIKPSKKKDIYIPKFKFTGVDSRQIKKPKKFTGENPRISVKIIPRRESDNSLSAISAIGVTININIEPKIKPDLPRVFIIYLLEIVI